MAGHWTARAGTFGDPVANPNIPPARRNGGLWIDANGDIWAYGGMTWAGTPYFFDMWKFTVSTASWALVSSISQAPVYGVQGQFSPSNTPGAREAFAYWSDPTHQLFFLFGGADNNWVTHFEDLWVYDTTQNQWAWIGGVQGSNNPDPTTYSNPGVLDRQWPLHRANLAWDVDATGSKMARVTVPPVLISLSLSKCVYLWRTVCFAAYARSLPFHPQRSPRSCNHRSYCNYNSAANDYSDSHHYRSACNNTSWRSDMTRIYIFFL